MTHHARLPRLCDEPVDSPIHLEPERDLGVLMPAYLVYVCHSVDDREELEEYWRVTQVTFEGQDMEVRAAYTPFVVLEGNDEVHGVVIAEFPSYEACRAWYDSPGYVSARQHRIRGASYLGILVDGGYQPVEQRMLHTKS
jgi:uncharacterized protein (DUF1330 family)